MLELRILMKSRAYWSKHVEEPTTHVPALKLVVGS
jgi:hypothetical protein